MLVLVQPEEQVSCKRAVSVGYVREDLTRCTMTCGDSGLSRAMQSNATKENGEKSHTLKGERGRVRGWAPNFRHVACVHLEVEVPSRVVLGNVVKLRLLFRREQALEQLVKQQGRSRGGSVWGA